MRKWFFFLLLLQASVCYAEDGYRLWLVYKKISSTRQLTALRFRSVAWPAIAGEDRKFVWAKSNISGKRLIVWNDSIPDPKYGRYAWADNPRRANLQNHEGLPASSFRTDN